MKIIKLLFTATILIAGCAPNNVTIDNSLEKFFTEAGTEGCFGMFNNRSGEFTIYNLSRYRDSAFTPASTFKIVNSLIGLQTGVITNDSMKIEWDGTTRSNAGWNKDLTMYEAFRVSSVPYYQEVARRVGLKTMKLWVDSINYGNKMVTEPVDSFWLNNQLKITPDEQLGLIKQLYFNQLPFFKSYQVMVKQAMLFEDKPAYKLYYKTGLGRKENGRMLGWIVGFIEESGHPYLFVLNMESADPDADISTVRLQVLKNILTHLQFMQGKK